MQGTTGVVLKVTVSTTLTAVTNLLDVPSFPEQVKILADMTAHPTTTDTVYRAMIDTGVRELTSFTVTLGWDSDETTHAAILTAFTATTALACSIEDPAGDEIIAFSAFIERIGRVSAMRDGYKAQVTITPTGAPTIT